MWSYFFSHNIRRNSVTSVTSKDTARLSDSSIANCSPRHSDNLSVQEIIDIHLRAFKNTPIFDSSYALKNFRLTARAADWTIRKSIINAILSVLKETTHEDLHSIEDSYAIKHFFNECCFTILTLLQPSDPVYLRIDVANLLLRCTYKGYMALESKKQKGPWNGQQDFSIPLFQRIKKSLENSPYARSIEEASCKALAQFIQPSDPKSLRDIIIRGLAIDNGYGFGAPYSEPAGMALIKIYKKDEILFNDVEQIFASNPYSDQRMQSGKRFLLKMTCYYHTSEETLNLSCGFSQDFILDR